MNRFAHRFALAVALSIGLLTSCARWAPADDNAAIDRLRGQIQKAEDAGNADEMVATMDQDVIVLPPEGAAITGAPAAVDFLKSIFASTQVTIQYKSLEVAISQDFAYDRGTYISTTGPKAGGPVAAARGKYLWLLRRQAGGGWKYSRLIWNTDAPPLILKPQMGGLLP